jgi:hypothetical protein
LKFDRITSIGEALPPETARRSVLEALRAESARGSLSLTMERAGRVSIPLEKGCRGYFMLVRLDKPMATIGEDAIVMSTGLSGYAKSDDELAFMIGRELALNNSNAPGNMKTAAYAGAFVTGMLRAVIPLPLPFGSGGTMAASAVRTSYEDDADRGAFELMVKAGYDPRVIPAFWSRVENDEKADHKALRASDARKKAWGEMIALVPQKAFDQMTATRNASEAKTHISVSTDDKIQSIVQLERHVAR